MPAKKLQKSTRYLAVLLLNLCLPALIWTKHIVAFTCVNFVRQIPVGPSANFILELLHRRRHYIDTETCPFRTTRRHSQIINFDKCQTGLER
jgi:hypothetical protein